MNGSSNGAPNAATGGAGIRAILAKLPDRPGVYLMRDERGRVLYVGKAQSLRNRVRQYWQNSRSATAQPLRIEQAMDRVADVEYTLTDTVSEALLLEANLVKRHQPRFNVRLKDDKSYPFIKVTLGDDFPRIERTRKLPPSRPLKKKSFESAPLPPWPRLSRTTLSVIVRLP